MAMHPRTAVDTAAVNSARSMWRSGCLAESQPDRSCWPPMLSILPRYTSCFAISHAPSVTLHQSRSISHAPSVGPRPRGDVGRREVEEALEDAPGDGGGRLAAVARLLEHHDDNVLRMVGGRVACKPGIRLLAVDVGGAGLGGHAHLVERESGEGPDGGAQRLLDGDAGEALLDHADRLGAHRELPGDLRCHRRHGLADVHDL